MNNKRAVWLIVGMLLILLVVNCSYVCVGDGAKGTVTYVNEHTGVSFSEPLTDEEMKQVADVLHGKIRKSMIFCGMPACGFDDNIAIVIGNTRYLLACDDCGTIVIDGSMDVIDISNDERDVLERIFTSRGGTFPCI